MSNENLFSPPIPQNSQNPLDDIGGHKMGPGGTDQSCKSHIAQQSAQSEGHNFVSTLKELSQDPTLAEHSPKTPQARSVESAISELVPAAEKAEIPAVVREIDHSHDDAITPSNLIFPATVDNQALQPDLDADLTAFLKMLGGMEPGEKFSGSDLQEVTKLNSVHGYRLDVVKSWIAHLQSNSTMTHADLKRMLTDPDFGRELNAKLLTGLPQTRQWLKEIIVGQQNQNVNLGLPAGEVGTGAKPSVTTPLDIEADVGAAGRSPGRSSGFTEFGSFKNPEDSAVPTKLANSGNLDSSGRKEIPDRMVWAAGQKEQNYVGEDQNRQSHKSSAISDRNPPMANILEDQSLSKMGQKPFAEVLPEAQQFKEAAIKAESAVNEETLGKVIKTDTGSNDSGQWSPSGQNPEKAGEIGPLVKETGVDQSAIRKQTLAQIVRRASVHLGNGQHEARIDLKPEYLGHIRMQVISENQQVTVKILAQHGFVKDMIESNVHQLKADLQQQGLAVDKLEVSVSHDAEDSDHSKREIAHSKVRRNHTHNQNEDRPEDAPQKEKRPAQATPDGSVTIDFFA